MPSNTVKFSPEKPAKPKNSHGLGITIFSAVILVVIVVTFIGAPVVSKAAAGSPLNFGSYDGLPIEYLQGNPFAKNVVSVSQLYNQIYQGQVDQATLQRVVWRDAFNQTALALAMETEARHAGIIVTDGLVTQKLQNYPSYLKDGVFNAALYDSTPVTDRAAYAQEVRSQLFADQYQLDRTNGALLSSKTKDFIASMAYPQTKFSFITFTDADYPAAQVAEYAQKNKNLFRTADLSRITVTSSLADAQKVRTEAVKGEKTFSDLAKTYSKDALAESGGALSVRHYYELKTDIAKTEDLDRLFALGKGAISEVIAGDKSWTIYKANSAAADADLTNTDTLAVVREYIAKNDRGLLEDFLEAQAKAFVDGAQKDFAGAAKKAGKTVSATGWVALNFGNHDLFPALTAATQDPSFQNLASNEDFFKKAFKLQAGQVSAPILASPVVFVLRADEVKTVAAKDDKAVSSDTIESSVTSERYQQLRAALLSPPKFKDTFDAEFLRTVQITQ